MADVAETDSFVVRWATTKDTQEILRMNEELTTFHHDPVSACAGAQKGLPEEIKNNSYWVQVLVAERQPATAERQLVGFALVNPGYSCYSGRRLRLEAIYVEDKYRGRGIGKALMKAIAKHATEQGCKKISWTVIGWNEKGISFYEALGATKDKWEQFSLKEEAIVRLSQEGE
ncbi:predicted protein [Nematostella vectensis]|uniref:N-acetyltransferase domain-containing protein n=1 Tax=Nematostella vectensis TaxID=45351 RepID=A7SDV2_NEMVE|nr:predicted protein [Nematostella vectensis]|eukprot:XP_001630203.1 predicted protein [Nematostella vectensis]